MVTHRGCFPAGWSRDGSPATAPDGRPGLILPSDLQSPAAQPGSLGGQQWQRRLVVVQEDVDGVDIHPPSVTDP